LLRHEPREAFDGGPYGISILTRLLQEAPPFLKDGGNLLFEFGLGQARMVQSLVDRGGKYSELRFALDANGEARAAVLRK
jgi:methylase of polypeptide subunit release factors